MKKTTTASTEKPTLIKKKPTTRRAPASAKGGADTVFPVVGMGGSAGSFKALEQFFTNMPADAGMAFVIVMHLDPHHSVNVAELIQNFTAMPVVQAEDDMPVKRDHVYIIPPQKDMGIHKRKLLLLTKVKGTGHPMPVDYFFQSLAEDQWNNAAAIILSGMGADGETGVRMIKEKLGMVMVQDPETADYNSMPNAALSTGLVDYVLPPEEMPVNLVRYLNHPALTDDTREQAMAQRKNAKAIQKILMLLRSHTGHDFSLYKMNTITRRIDRRIAFNQLADYSEYVAYLRENPNEIDVLFNELLIGVTKFFRDPEAFEALKVVLHRMLKKKQDDEPVRIWVAGCSTGEEAYSVAMLVMEYYQSLKVKRLPKPQIFATDLDADAIEHARMGVYYDNIVSDVSEERLERFFLKKGDSYSVKKELREMLVFAQHNLIKDAPFTRLDLLCCRNMMIYVTAELQRKILPIFHYSLKPNGVLFLGAAESIGSFSNLFSPLDPKWKLFERRPGTSTIGKLGDFPFNISAPGMRAAKAEAPFKHPKKTPLADTFRKLMLDHYTPPSVLINQEGDILYISGKAGKFLEISAGEAAMNIHRMARQELRFALANAIRQVFSNRSALTTPDIKITENGHQRLVNFQVQYLDKNPLEGLALIVFEDKGIAQGKSKRRANASTGDMVEELEKELLYVKEQLHTTVEQMETSVEELKSTNEELQSTNEELQSTNEESLTTKEEMQSLNEELMTINTQYQIKGDELNQLNNDMKNLLDSTETGTIFLDNSLNILRFTPQVKKLFNVITADVGRSITHVVSNFDYPAIEDAIYDVIETLNGKEMEVKTHNGDWYNLRIIPYRTLDNFISGAVLTFNKITPVKALEDKLLMLEKYTDLSIELLEHPALLLNSDMMIQTINKAFLAYFKVRRQEVVDHSISELIHNKWQTNKLDDMLEKSLLQGESLTLHHEFPVIGLKKIFINSLPSIDKKTGKAFIILITIKEGKD